MAFQEGPFMRIRDLGGPYEYWSPNFTDGIFVEAFPRQAVRDFGSCDVNGDLPSCPSPPWERFSAVGFRVDCNSLNRYDYDATTCSIASDLLTDETVTATESVQVPAAEGDWIAEQFDSLPGSWGAPHGAGLCDGENPSRIAGDVLGYSFRGYCCSSSGRGLLSAAQDDSGSVVASYPPDEPVRLTVGGRRYELVELIDWDASRIDMFVIYDSIWKNLDA